MTRGTIVEETKTKHYSGRRRGIVREEYWDKDGHWIEVRWETGIITSEREGALVCVSSE